MWVGTVDAGAFTMDCCRFGQGRETLVILPGISLQRVMGTAGAIAGAYRKLAESCEICVFERRNDMPPGYGVRDMALDTARAMEALGLGPAHLFGASQGGMMAMALAALRPELVKRLILGSTSARISDERYGAVFEPWARLARAGDAAALCRTFAEAVYPRRVFGKLGPLLSELAEPLERILTTPCNEEKRQTIEKICAAVTAEVRRQGLAETESGDLEKLAYAVNDRVRDPQLRNAHILAAV